MGRKYGCGVYAELRWTKTGSRGRSIQVPEPLISVTEGGAEQQGRRGMRARIEVNHCVSRALAHSLSELQQNDMDNQDAPLSSTPGYARVYYLTNGKTGRDLRARPVYCFARMCALIF